MSSAVGCFRSAQFLVLSAGLVFGLAGCKEDSDSAGDVKPIENLESDEAVEYLPHSENGYELYFWREDGQMFFTLLTASEQATTPAQVFSSPRSDTNADGSVAITVAGFRFVRVELARLPRGEEVTLIGVRKSPVEAFDYIDPPQKMKEILAADARQSGWKLHVGR